MPALQWLPATGLFAVVIAGVIARQGVQNRRYAEMLGRQQVRQSALIDLVRHGLQQRKQLECDLHDGAQQSLLGVALRLRAIEERTHEPDVQRAVAVARRDVLTALEELRDLAHGIYPSALARGGLRGAIKQVSERLALPVQLSCGDDRWPTAVEAGVYFFVCEALTNIAKHGPAGPYRVEIDQRGADLLCSISDGGLGWQELTGTHCLASLRSRVAILNGSLQVSAAGSGTRVEARIPCA